MLNPGEIIELAEDQMEKVDFINKVHSVFANHKWKWANGFGKKETVPTKKRLFDTCLELLAYVANGNPESATGRFRAIRTAKAITLFLEEKINEKLPVITISLEGEENIVDVGYVTCPECGCRIQILAKQE